jgi:hypothetical protein
MEWTQERLDAMAQTLELVVSLHRDNEVRLKQLMEMSTQLGNITLAHDHQLEDHEARLTDIEHGGGQ